MLPAGLGLALLLAACAAPPPPLPPPPPPPVNETLQGAVNSVLLDIARQLGAQAASERPAVFDPLLDSRSGQQTQATARVQQVLQASLAQVMPGVKLLTFDAAGAQDARWLFNGTLAAQPATPGAYRLTVALSDRSSGLVVARGVAPLRDEPLDEAPVRFYSDSPALVRDRAVQGYIDTTEKPVGQAADALYLEQIPTAALLNEAQEAYNEERWDRALELMSTAAQRDDGQQLRTFNGLYLANMKLGRTTEAEQAFGKIAALGLATSNLAVKILFRPGSTDFMGDDGPIYAMWLRQIARAAQGSELCLNIVGHTSKTGSEAVNRQLSLRRAQVMRERLVRDAPSLGRGQRLRTEGKGWEEAIVGTGTDDLRDALDRRVEFKVLGCT
ncbi:OmpA family protein [Pseudorhodoferax sp.]|uniref:OmpA family protein n=1 Tax=Pseudorhodoferax sp. TaxID=1993553 RepID=UPI002DD65F5C|nr:OmpA family protein [Pseudorhodoferax sp.]